MLLATEPILSMTVANLADDLPWEWLYVCDFSI